MGDHSSAPMFSVLHFSDLLFPFEPSQNVENENRDLSVGSQLEEISEELNLLFRDLKRRHLWDNTIVVVAGLSGGRDPSSLKSDQTQVSLFIKPSRLKRDQATAWGVDVNVSLADVGVTLLEVLGGQVKENLLKERVTLTSVFNQPEPKWSEDRLLLAENYWSFENFGLDIVRSVRRKNLFYIHQEPPLLFNTLTDRNEQSPLPMTDNIYSLHFDAFREFLQSGVKRAQVVEIPSWFRAGVEGFRKGEWSQWESEIEPNSPLSAWVLRDLMENGAWEKVLTRSDESPFLAFLAHSRLEPRSDYGSLIQEYACSEAFTEASLGELSHLRDTCDQDRLLQYVDWIGHRGSTKELLYENRFRKSYQFWWARLELGAMNYAAYGALGIPLAWPRRPDISELFILHREKRRPRSLMSGYTSRGKYSL
jgi:hypothetical protein